MEISLKQQIYYTNRELVPLSEVAESLIALQAIIEKSPLILERLFPGTRIHGVHVYVDELRSGSIIEDLIIKLIFGDQEQFDIMLSKARKYLKMEHLVKNPAILSVVILALIVAGGAYYVAKSNEPNKQTTINASHNTIIQIGAGMVDMSAEEFGAIIESAISNHDELAKNAAKVVKPAKRDPKAEIIINGNDDLKLDAKTIAAMPSYIKESSMEDFKREFDALEVEIRAGNLDSLKSGWTAIVPSMGNRKIKLLLDPGVAAEDLFGDRKIKLKLTLLYRTEKNGSLEPYSALVKAIVKGEGELGGIQ